MRFAYTWTTATVRSCEMVADDVRMIELVPADGVRSYPPGSHLQISVVIDGEPETRYYSLVGEARGDAYRIAVRLRPDGLGGSAYMHRLREGAEVEVTHPANHFELSYGAPSYLLVAGGIGITPLVSMAQMLRKRGADYRLAYVGRNRESMPFLAELAAEHGDRLLPFVSSEGNRVALEELFAGLPADGEVYFCGPQGLREQAARLWQAQGRPAVGLRFETFASSGDYPPEPFTVTVADRDLTVEVGEHVSMLDALKQAGVEMMWDCLRGECGLCAVDVLETTGLLDHRDVFLSEAQREAGRKICTCVSRVAKGDVVVDTGRRTDFTVSPSATN